MVTKEQAIEAYLQATEVDAASFPAIGNVEESGDGIKIILDLDDQYGGTAFEDEEADILKDEMEAVLNGATVSINGGTITVK